MKGFTLIELLIAFSITTVLAAISFSSFSSYNRSQVMGSSVSEVSSLLNIARARSVSQVKPIQCGVTPLDGYKVTTTSATDYELDVVCGGSTITIAKKKLPSQVVFDSASIPSVLFEVSTGIVPVQGSFIITGFGKSTPISIDKIGKISKGFEVAAIPASTPPPSTPTAGVTPFDPGSCTGAALAYRLYYGYCVYYSPGNGEYCNSTCTIPAPTPTPVTPPGSTPIPACSRDYYYVDASTCHFVGGDRGGYCESTCGGRVGVAAPTPTPIPAAPTPTPIPSACSKNYYFSAPSYCTYVGGNNGQYCESTCGGQVGGAASTPVPAAPTPTPIPAANSAPITTNATISSPSITANGVSQYTITVTGTDSNGGNDIGTEYAIINYQGANVGAYRGFIGWTATGSFVTWGSYKSGTPIACAGSGQAAINADPNWGQEYINLISCSAPVVSGSTRVITFVVTFNTNFTAPTTNNTISGYVRDWGNLEDSPIWKPFGTFSLSASTVAAPTPTPVASCSKDYYSSPPYCVFVGGGNGQYCSASCTF